MAAPYIPHTDADRAAMLDIIGAASIDELFREIPENLRVAPGAMDLPPALDEPRLMATSTSSRAATSTSPGRSASSARASTTATSPPP